MDVKKQVAKNTCGKEEGIQPGKEYKSKSYSGNYYSVARENSL